MICRYVKGSCWTNPEEAGGYFIPQTENKDFQPRAHFVLISSSSLFLKNSDFTWCLRHSCPILPWMSKMPQRTVNVVRKKSRNPSVWRIRKWSHNPVFLPDLRQMIDFRGENDLLRAVQSSRASWLQVIEHVTKHKKREAEVIGEERCVSNYIPKSQSLPNKCKSLDASESFALKTQWGLSRSGRTDWATITPVSLQWLSRWV